MRSNAVGFGRSGISALSLGIVLAIIIMAVTLTLGSRGRGWQSNNRGLPADSVGLQAEKPALQADTRAHFSIEDPRPLAKAIQLLERKHSIVITYEDPRYSHTSEILDVTEKVRRDLDKFEPGKAPKVLIPKGGILSFEYDEALTAKTDYQVLLVQTLIDAYSASGNAGRFRVEQQGKVTNVIPIAVRSMGGKVAPQSSLLDAVITVRQEQRSGSKMLQAICTAIKETTGTRVLVVGFPLRLFLRYQNEEGITGERARDALVELLAKVEDEAPLSWQLLYDPGLKMYLLNIYEIQPLVSHEPR